MILKLTSNTRSIVALLYFLIILNIYIHIYLVHAITNHFLIEFAHINH